MGQSHSETLHLLDRAKAGDTQARGDLLERYEERIRRIVWIRGSAPRLSARISPGELRKVLIEAFDALDQLQALDDASVVKWLIDRVEGQPGGAAGPATPAGAQDLEADLADVERVDRQLAGLSRDCREAFILRHFMGMSFIRIAQELGGITPNAVRDLYRRARGQLVAGLSEEEGR